MVLEIIVMVKQVPDSQEVVIDPVTMNLNRSLTRNVTRPLLNEKPAESPAIMYPLPYSFGMDPMPPSCTR